MQNKPLVVVYCKASDREFECCHSSSEIRAVANFSPKFPNEELWIKHCQLHYHKLGECKHQFPLDRLPRIPAFFVKKLRPPKEEENNEECN